MHMRKMMAAALTGLALVGLAGTASAQTNVTPVHKTKAELQKQADEFSAHQKRTFSRIFRGAQNVSPGNWGGEAEGVFDDMQYMDNSTSFTYQGRQVTVITQVHAPGFYPETPKQLCEHEKCVGEVSDHRGGVTVFTELDQFGIRSATNFRPNGEVVWAQGTKQDDPARLGAVAADRYYTFTR